MAVLKANKRDSKKLGTRHTRKLRQAGDLPVIIYGHGKDPVAAVINGHDLTFAIHHGERLMEIDLEGQQEHVLLKDVQYDVFGQEILHVDLTRVDLNERVEVVVPLVLHGTPKGVSEENGVLQQPIAEVTVECVVTDIPDHLDFRVNDMALNDTHQLSELELPKGAKLIDDPETVFCSVTFISEEEVAEGEEEAGAAEPEVIGETADEDQADDATETNE